MKKYIMLGAAIGLSGLAAFASNGYYAPQTPSYTYQRSNRCSGEADGGIHTEQPYTAPQGQGANYDANARQQRADYDANNNNGGYSLPKPDKRQQNFRDNRFKSEADQAMYAQFMNKLREGRFSNVQVMISNGSVTLQGTVPTQEDRNDLDNIVRNMRIAKNINNQVTVQPQQ